MTNENEKIICRCEEVTQGEIIDAIRRFDLKTTEDVKRITRVGMGLCQGRTCEHLVQRILATISDLNIGDLKPISKRPPALPIEIESLANIEGDEN